MQDVKISLERINEIHCKKGEDDKPGLLNSVYDKSDGISVDFVDFKYDPHAIGKTLDNVSMLIQQGKVVESGNHDRLIKLHGFYYDLVKNQLELGE